MAEQANANAFLTLGARAIDRQSIYRVALAIDRPRKRRVALANWREALADPDVAGVGAGGGAGIDVVCQQVVAAEIGRHALQLVQVLNAVNAHERRKEGAQHRPRTGIVLRLRAGLDHEPGVGEVETAVIALLQGLRRGEAGTAVGTVALPGRGHIPIAVGDGRPVVVITQQATGIAIAGDQAAGVAAPDRYAITIADQAAHEAVAHSCACRVAVFNRSPVTVADQTTDFARSGNRAGCVAFFN